MLFLQSGFEFRLVSREVLFIASGIEEDLRAVLGEARQLILEVEIAAMRAEENVARERSQHAEGAREILRDARVRRRLAGSVDEVEVRPEAHAADDHDVAQLIGGLAGHMDGKGPGGAAAGMARGLVSREHGAAEIDDLAVVQNSVDVCRRVGRHRAGRSEEVGAAAALDDLGVALHDHVLRVRLT